MKKLKIKFFYLVFTILIILQVFPVKSLASEIKVETGCAVYYSASDITIEGRINKGQFGECKVGFYFGESESSLVKKAEQEGGYHPIATQEFNICKWVAALDNQKTYYYCLYMRYQGVEYKGAVMCFTIADLLVKREKTQINIRCPKLLNANINVSYVMFAEAYVEPKQESMKITSWQSSNPSIVKISDIKDNSCKIDALKEGKATIKVTARNGKSTLYEVTCIIPVKMSKSEVSLKKGEKIRLTAGTYFSSTNSSEKVKWKSSNQKIATVDAQGNVKAVGTGLAIITAEFLNDEGRCAVFVIPSEKDVYNSIYSLKTKYKHGMQWDDQYYYESIADNATFIGQGCIGFALLLSDAAFNNLPITFTKMNTKKIKIGDIISLNCGWHYVLVLKTDSKEITIAEGNWQKKISWDRKLSWSYIKMNGTQILTRYKMQKLVG